MKGLRRFGIFNPVATSRGKGKYFGLEIKILEHFIENMRDSHCQWTKFCIAEGGPEPPTIVAIGYVLR